MRPPPEPTIEACTTSAPVEWAQADGSITKGMATWYPQMGGYSGKAVVARSSECVDVWVWHDGEFPFDGGQDPDAAGTDPDLGRDPVRLHHCDVGQFRTFADTVEKWLEAETKP